MTLPPEPFYFSGQGGELFAVYQAPLGPSRQEGIVICNPLPQEMMRAHPALVQLTKTLAERGFAVLRFDYFATGDSAGRPEDISLAAWESNIKSAVSSLKKRSAVSQVSLCGLRLGARLALRVSEDIGLRQLVLWDPIADGSAYVKRLEESHYQMIHRMPHEAPMPSTRYQLPQCWGFAWPESFRRELSQWQSQVIQSACKRIHIVQSERQESWPEISQRLRAKGAEVQESTLDQPLHWDDDRYMKIRCFPTAHIKLICQAFEGGR